MRLDVGLTEEVFSSICFVVGILWEMINLLTYASECSCRGEKQIVSDFSISGNTILLM